MNKIGVRLRSACRSILEAFPPRLGELAWDIDTDSFVWSTTQNDIIFNNFIVDNKSIVFKGYPNPPQDLGEVGDKYMQYIEYTDRYTEWTKTVDGWIKINFYRILDYEPEPDDFPDDIEGTIYYVLL